MPWATFFGSRDFSAARDQPCDADKLFLGVVEMARQPDPDRPDGGNHVRVAQPGHGGAGVVHRNGDDGGPVPFGERPEAHALRFQRVPQAKREPRVPFEDSA